MLNCALWCAKCSSIGDHPHITKRSWGASGGQGGGLTSWLLASRNMWTLTNASLTKSYVIKLRKTKMLLEVERSFADGTHEPGPGSKAGGDWRRDKYPWQKKLYFAWVLGKSRGPKGFLEMFLKMLLKSWLRSWRGLTQCWSSQISFPEHNFIPQNFSHINHAHDKLVN